MKRVYIPLLMAVISLLVAVPVLAAYYVDIDVTESNGTDYDMLAMNVSLDIDYLAEHGFIDDDGLDVRIKDSLSNEMPFMLAADRIVFASDITADMVNSFQMTTGNTPLDSFPVCVGDGGYVTVSDHANLELGDDFELEWDGYVASDVADSLIEKTAIFETYSDGGGNIVAEIYDKTSVEQTSQDSTTTLYSGGNTRVGQRIDSFADSNIVKISFYLKKTGSPTGTAYIRVRKVSDDSILGTIGTLDVSTLTGAYVWHDFEGCIVNPSSQNLRFLIEYSGGSAANKVEVGYENSNVGTGSFTYYDGAWTDNDLFDMTYKVDYTVLDVSVTAAVSSGEHKITLTADSTDFKIYEDDVEKDSVALAGASVPNNGLDWTLGSDAIPYFTYTHKVGVNDRINYAPDSIISGTTLPNEESPGTYDGTITWGSNPAGISIATSALQLESTYYYEDIEGTSEDIFAPEPAELISGVDLERLENNPMYPLVKGIVDASNNQLTTSLVWILGAWIITIAAYIATFILMREHIIFAGLVGEGLAILFYAMGIFDYWVLILFAFGIIAGIVQERTPTW